MQNIQKSTPWLKICTRPNCTIQNPFPSPAGPGA